MKKLKKLDDDLVKKQPDVRPIKLTLSFRQKQQTIHTDHLWPFVHTDESRLNEFSSPRVDQSPVRNSLPGASRLNKLSALPIQDLDNIMIPWSMEFLLAWNRNEIYCRFVFIFCLAGDWDVGKWGDARARAERESECNCAQLIEKMAERRGETSFPSSVYRIIYTPWRWLVLKDLLSDAVKLEPETTRGRKKVDIWAKLRRSDSAQCCHATVEGFSVVLRRESCSDYVYPQRTLDQ